MITFGAQDFKNLTNKVLSHLLKESPQFNYHVVTGSNNAEKIEQGNIYYYNLLNAAGMLNLMINCDLAVTAAGQTTYELARVGIPTVAIGVAKNQKYNIAGWLTSNFVTDMIWFDDEKLFDKIINQIHKLKNKDTVSLVDGQGSRRVVNYAIN